MRSYQLLVVFATMTVLLLLTGCGSSAATGATGLSTIGTAYPPATAVAKPSRSVTSVSTSGGSTGPVTLHLDASSYRTSDTISLTLSNQSSQTIYFPDHLTNCTVILLQRQKFQPVVVPPESENGQAGINPCRHGMSTRMHSLAAEQSLVVKLVASFNGWVPGLYFATLNYSTSLTSDPPKTISSAVFQVGAAVSPRP